MAQGIKLVCNKCRKAIEAWDDGNPYYIEWDGTKHYAYHPDRENFERCIGNDDPHLCLSCGTEFMVDNLAPISRCPKCASEDICTTYHLDGKSCPFCTKGTFVRDPNYSCIS
jgi:predicted RNA-binding Zn-ribbon protein involved in translation (DUF1610 family)